MAKKNVLYDDREERKTKNGKSSSVKESSSINKLNK